MELWDLYDKDKNPIGKTHQRGKQLNPGEYHLVAAIWVVNDRGELLVTRRHPGKIHGNLWEAPGGAVRTGEDSISGAMRELYEETGIECKDNELNLLRTLVKASWIVDIYLLRKSIPVEELRLQQEEVTDAKWVSITEFEDMCLNRLVAPFVIDDYRFCRDVIFPATEESI